MIYNNLLPVPGLFCFWGPFEMATSVGLRRLLVTLTVTHL